jgi:hypothetical protein
MRSAQREAAALQLTPAGHGRYILRVGKQRGQRSAPAEYLHISWLPITTCEKLMLTTVSPRPTLAGTSGRQLENQPCIWSNENVPAAAAAAAV